MESENKAPSLSVWKDTAIPNRDKLLGDLPCDLNFQIQAIRFGIDPSGSFRVGSKQQGVQGNLFIWKEFLKE